MIHLSWTAESFQEDWRKVILPPSWERSACELCCCYCFLNKQVSYQGWAQRDENENKKIWIESQNDWEVQGQRWTIWPYVVGLLRGRAGSKMEGYVPRNSMIHTPTWKILVSILDMVVLLDWLHWFKYSIHLARFDSVWQDHPCFDVMSLANSVKEQFIMKPFNLNLREICWMGMVSPLGFLNSILFPLNIHLNYLFQDQVPSPYIWPISKASQNEHLCSVYGASQEGISFTPHPDACYLKFELTPFSFFTVFLDDHKNGTITSDSHKS